MFKRIALIMTGGILFCPLIANAAIVGYVECGDTYVNIRSAPYIEADPVGKIYNYNQLEVEDFYAGDGWYKVKSGNCEGYIASMYVATGDDINEIRDKIGYEVADIYAAAANVRAEPSTDSTIIDTVYAGQKVEVIEKLPGWAKVCIAFDSYGYINDMYLGYKTEYGYAETLEEEADRVSAAVDEQSYTTNIDDNSVNNYEEPTITYDEIYQSGYETYDEATQSGSLEYENDVSDESCYDETEAAVTNDYDIYSDDVSSEVDEYNAYSYDTSTEVNDYAEDIEDTTETISYEEYSNSVTDESQNTSAETDVPVNNPGLATGSEIVNYALQFVGNPYVYGGNSLTNGVDCSGFTQQVFGHFGIELPRTAASQASCGTRINVNDIQPGDLLFYDNGGYIGHVSIYCGDGEVVHASNENTGITVSSVDYRTPVAAARYIH